MGRNSTNYYLLLGLELSLEKRVVEINPEYKGSRDKKHSPLILSDISIEQYNNLTSEERDSNFYNNKKISLGHIFPDGSIAESLLKANLLASQYDSYTRGRSKLCFITDDKIEDQQLLGQVLYNSYTFDDSAICPIDEKKLKKGLNTKSRISEMINQYGFNTDASDIHLHHYISVGGW